MGRLRVGVGGWGGWFNGEAVGGGGGLALYEGRKRLNPRPARIVLLPVLVSVLAPGTEGHGHYESGRGGKRGGGNRGGGGDYTQYV